MVHQTIIDVFQKNVEKLGQQPFIYHKQKAENSYTSVSWQQLSEMTREFAAGMIKIGMEPGDRLAMILFNCLEWIVADLGTFQAGGVDIPVYHTNTADQCIFIVNDAECKFVMVEDLVQLEKLVEKKSEIKHVEKIILVKGNIPKKQKDWVISYADLMGLGKRHQQELDGEISIVKKGITIDQMATIVYTSGTTGPPKGCMVSHENIVKVLGAIDEMHEIDAETNRSLLVLPLSHFYPRVSGYYFNLFKGIPLALGESIDTLAANLAEVRPTYFCCVPRILEKVYAKIQNTTEKGSVIQKAIFNWAMNVGKAKMRQQQTIGQRLSLGLSFQSLIADRLVFKKIRGRLGGELSFVVSAGAPLLAEVGEFVYCLGIKVIEFYGLSESLGGTMTTLDVCRYGTVGKPMPGFDVKLADDGEILIHGNNFMGYYNNPEKTNEVLKEGWCYTEDIGLFDDEGFLKVIDRKKDLIITSGGKNIAPQNLENTVISQISLVSNAMVYGDMKNYLTILLTLDPEAVKEFAEDRGLTTNNYEEILQSTEVNGYVQEQLNTVNSCLAKFETLKKFVILPREFSMEDGEITPTLKLKRKIVKNKFKHLMEALYQ